MTAPRMLRQMSPGTASTKQYKNSDPNRDPKRIPASIVNKYCSVNGTTGIGILINAPTAISAVNKAQYTRLLVSDVM